MTDFPLNEIIKSDSGWTCHVFTLDQINAGGLYLSLENYDDINVDPFVDYSYRYYKRTKKIVISSSKPVNFNYCALDFQYKYWKCLVCRKLSEFSEADCFCKTYSNCWTPVDGIISGISFSNELDFPYHFIDNSLSNIIL
jgi:hypothetical protein